MDINGMHVLFRTLGQQMGFQQIRGILPESIDNFINLSIHKSVEAIIKSNVLSITPDVRTPQYAKISPINGIHTLYVTENISVSGLGNNNDNNQLSVVLQNAPMIYTNFEVKYIDDENHYDMRFIEPERVSMTNKDYLNRASQEYPIITLISGNAQNDITVALFTGGVNDKVSKLIVQYIKMPATVVWDTNSENRVDCDLPEHLHKDVVELAVQLWMQTLGLTSQQARNENNN